MEPPVQQESARPDPTQVYTICVRVGSAESSASARSGSMTSGTECSDPRDGLVVTRRLGARCDTIRQDRQVSFRAAGVRETRQFTVYTVCIHSSVPSSADWEGQIRRSEVRVPACWRLSRSWLSYRRNSGHVRLAECLPVRPSACYLAASANEDTAGQRVPSNRVSAIR